MAKKCETRSKGKIFGSTISSFHRRGNRTWSPDVRRVHVIIDGSPKRIYVRTRCLHSRKVKGALWSQDF